MLTKKSRFFDARPNSKLVYIGAKFAFKRNLGSVTKKEKWISQNQGRILDFLEWGADFQKNYEHFVDRFFGRPN